MTALTFSVLAIVVYAGVLAAGLFASQPLRLRMVALLGEMVDAGEVKTDAERDHLAGLIDTSTSTAVGLLLPAAAAFVLASELLGAPSKKPDPELAQLAGIERYRRFVVLYAASVTCCSPFAFLLSAPALAALAVISVVRQQKISTAVEGPYLSATKQLHQC